MPKLLDTESSQTHVFIRKNIEEKTRVDEHTGGEAETYYEYEEVQVTKEEYQKIVNEQLQVENSMLKAQLDEQADAMVELAGLFEEMALRSEEQDAALIELAALMV
ncbi:MAG: hypothetical protein NC548_52245 [Lachnospiraceae bacterium]|nr:hypothetical protein [Lachnospiraceae bacterium]